MGTCPETAIRAIPPGLEAPALKSALSEFVAELPDSTASALRHEGTLGGKGKPRNAGSPGRAARCDLRRG